MVPVVLNKITLIIPISRQHAKHQPIDNVNPKRLNQVPGQRRAATSELMIETERRRGRQRQTEADTHLSAEADTHLSGNRVATSRGGSPDEPSHSPQLAQPP